VPEIIEIDREVRLEESPRDPAGNMDEVIEELSRGSDPEEVEQETVDESLGEVRNLVYTEESELYSLTVWAGLQDGSVCAKLEIRGYDPSEERLSNQLAFSGYLGDLDFQVERLEEYLEGKEEDMEALQNRGGELYSRMVA
jgi:hypothetical protein